MCVFFFSSPSSSFFGEAESVEERDGKGMRRRYGTTQNIPSQLSKESSRVVVSSGVSRVRFFFHLFYLELRESHIRNGQLGRMGRPSVRPSVSE